MYQMWKGERRIDMDSFLQKLINDTTSGDLDGVWKYVDSSKTYSFVIPKHYLNGMNLSLENNFGSIIFPDGFMMNYTKENINQLIKVINISLQRTVETWMLQYLSENMGQVQTPDTAEPSSNDQPQEKDDKNVPLES